MSIIKAKAESWLRQQPTYTADLVIVDPPYNIGYDYGEGGYDDNKSPDAYGAWLLDCFKQTRRVLKPDGTFWIIMGDEWVADARVLARQAGFSLRSWVVWYYTFGVNCKQKLTRSHAHLLYMVSDPKKFYFNTDSERVPSAREVVYKDKRAAKGGRLPDDTWILYPSDDSAYFSPNNDVWLMSRVCGTFKERIEGAANQLPEKLIGRIVNLCSKPGDVVLDWVAGTGTTAAVAKKLGRVPIGCEMDPKFVTMANTRLSLVNPGDLLSGEFHK